MLGGSRLRTVDGGSRLRTVTLMDSLALDGHIGFSLLLNVFP